MNVKDDSAALIEHVRQAVESKIPLRIIGGNSKADLYRISDDPNGSTLNTGSHEGIISYEPTELVVSVRAGTLLADLNATLSAAGQMLPFDPPALPGSTIGGVISGGFSGPRRPFNGAARDYVLGTRIINGRAQDLSFGGEVMKNVAGYDVSRLQVGAWGTLGVLLDISMKVLPVPERELTLVQQSAEGDTRSFLPLLRKPVPLSGAMLIGNQRYLRLSGSDAAVRAAAAEIGGDSMDDANSLWESVRDHRHDFFNQNFSNDQSLWRLSVADHAPAIDLPGQWLYEWAGAQRWLITDAPSADVFKATRDASGHASRCRVADDAIAAIAVRQNPVFQPLTGPMQRLQSRLRDSFDPDRIFNRGRFHPELDVSAKAVATGV